MIERGPHLNGETLRLLRITRGMSQQALAERIGKTPSAISEMERGRRQPYPKTLLALAEALGVEPATLLKHPSSPQP